MFWPKTNLPKLCFCYKVEFGAEPLLVGLFSPQVSTVEEEWGRRLEKQTHQKAGVWQGVCHQQPAHTRNGTVPQEEGNVLYVQKKHSTNITLGSVSARQACPN